MTTCSTTVLSRISFSSFAPSSPPPPRPLSTLAEGHALVRGAFLPRESTLGRGVRDAVILEVTSPACLVFTTNACRSLPLPHGSLLRVRCLIYCAMRLLSLVKTDSMCRSTVLVDLAMVFGGAQEVKGFGVLSGWRSHSPGSTIDGVCFSLPSHLSFSPVSGVLSLSLSLSSLRNYCFLLVWQVP